MTAPVAPRGFSEASVQELLASRGEPEWLRERRLEAWRAYLQQPMPTRQDEEWRRTDISRLRLDQITPHPGATTGPAGAPATLRPSSEREEAYGGFLGLRNSQAAERSLHPDWVSKGVIFTDLATAVREYPDLVREHLMTRCVRPEESKFAALHGAFWQNGTFLYVPRGVEITEPLRAITSAAVEAGASLTHTLIVLEEGSRAVFAEDFMSDDVARPGFTSRVVELIAGRNSVLYYVGVQRWGRGVYDMHTERALVGRDANVTMQTIELGSQLSKGRVEGVMSGQGGNVRLLGLYIGDEKQHLDRYTLQDHRAANCTSDLLFKGVLAGAARSVFSGLIRVLPEGRGTAAYQQNRNLLLSRAARADSIPNLEIGANDIIGCSHGATVGKVDEEQLFYLMCRGLNRNEATRLIVEGFVAPVLDTVPIVALREALRQEVRERVSTVRAE